MMWAIAGAVVVGIAVLLTWLSSKRGREHSVQGLREVLGILDAAFTDNDISYPLNAARWSGTIAGRSVELEYFSDTHVPDDSLALLIPYSTRRNINYTNTRDYAPFHKKSFEQANEIFLSLIKDEALKAALENMIQDNRFVRLKARMRTHELKFAPIPSYDEKHRIKNEFQEDPTDALSIRISKVRQVESAPQRRSVDREFLLAVIRLLYEVRNALEVNEKNASI